MDARHKPEKRESIIKSTLELFGSTHNINKVSLEAIAKAAGVSPTTIYNLFGTRENLIIEVIKLISRENLEKNRQIIHSKIPFPQKLALIVSGKQDLMSKYDRELIEKIIKQDEKIRPFIDEIYLQDIRPLWHEILREGKAQGYIEESVDDEAFLIYLDIVKAGIAAREDLLAGLVENPAKVAEITKLMFFGFLKKDISLFKEG